MKGYYRCKLAGGYSVNCYVIDPGDESEFSLITDIRARVYSKERECVGFFKGQIVRLAGENSRDVLLDMDGHSQGLSDVACALLLDGKPLNFLLNDSLSDLFNLERLRIHRRHRGKKLGLQVCAATIMLAKEFSASFCTLKPFPLQWEGCYDQEAEQRNEEAERDFKRLTEYYKTLGFHDGQCTQGVYWLDVNQASEILGFGADDWKLRKAVRTNKSDSLADFESKFA